ncbi:MAG TPA: hypothetical protein VHN20_12425 [Beijerinckiaceae bacterium]|nr:hypothetical protein [Beijerinckiaceae bacterium]
MPSFKWGTFAKLGTAIMGLAALFTADARAATEPTGTPKDGVVPSRLGIGEVLVCRDGHKLYISENGVSFEELTLDDTDDGVRLSRLLNEMKIGADPVAISVGRVIVADGGSSINAPRQAGRSDRADENRTRSK